MDKYKILCRDKGPVTKHNYVGIEIEFISPMDCEEVEDLLMKYDLQYNCTLKEDGSIEGWREAEKGKMPMFVHECRQPGYDSTYNYCEGCELEDEWCDNHASDWNGHEVTILTTESEMRDVLNRMNKVLKACKAEVNETCGLHVHLDMRNRDMKKSVKALLKKQSEFHKMVHKSRLTNTMCKPLTKGEARFGCDTRYRDINLLAYNKFGTIEVRIHEGCVKTAEIYDWCRYLIAVVDNKKVSKAYVQKRIEACA